MINYRALLIKLKVFWIIAPFNKIILKTGNFTKMSLWIARHQILEYKDSFSLHNDYTKRYALFQYIIENKIKNIHINYLEFGVSDGETIKWWTQNITNPGSLLFGFDTFEGLPEDWGVYKKGAFTNNGEIPNINDTRVKFYKGLFQETLSNFLVELNNSRKNIIMLDADLYSSTLYVLTTIAPYLKKDDIIVFDEFLAPQHEFLAYYNFCEAFPHIKLQLFAASNNYSFVGFQVL